MLEVKETRISIPRVRSLVWHGNTLFDWVDGGRQFTLDGEIRDGRVRYAFPFDAAVASPSGEYSAIYTRLGTKGLILRQGKVLREINRSYYQADVYEFPIALIRLETGREVIVHCPSRYNQLEIEDLATGESLTNSTNRNPSDFFHSRLAGSPDGKFLVSAGWVWHPIDVVQLYDLAAAVADPRHLDGNGLGIKAWADDGCSAAFLPNGQLAVDLVGFELDDEAPNSLTEALYLFDPSLPRTPKVVRRTDRLGMMMTVGTHHMLGLYEHPKLIDLRTGEIEQRWPHIKCGTQVSSILAGGALIPPIALDDFGQRCAIADAGGINVLEFLPSTEHPLSGSWLNPV